jgi:hypothetical protein
VRRLLLNLLTVLSILLLAAASAAWWRSYRSVDMAIFGRGGLLVRVGHDRGSCTLEWTRGWGGAQHIGARLESWPIDHPIPWTWSRLAQFGHVKRTDILYLARGRQVPVTFDCFWAPQWVFVTAFACLPAWRLGRWLLGRYRRKRLEAGSVPCRRCGYDLRATPGRCPECGDGGEARTAGTLQASAEHPR